MSANGERVALLALGGLLAGLALVPAAPAQESADAATEGRGAVELVFDASGSMRVDDAGGGLTRIEAAREALRTLIDELPQGAPIGLRVYGNTRTPAQQRRSCDRTTLVQPIAPLDPARMGERLDSFQPGGSTPIGLALLDAARDLRGQSEQVIVLVSDGRDTCAPPDPCKVAARLSRSGIDLRVQAIGFKTGARATRALRCIARATGGVYRDADDAESLADSLLAATLRALRGYRVAGEEVAFGTTPEAAPVIDEGQYLDEIRLDRGQWYAVDLPAGTGLVASTTVVPPLPRIPSGVATAPTATLRTSLHLSTDPAADPDAAEPGASSTAAPEGEELDSESEIGLVRSLAAGEPVTLTNSSGGVTDEDGRAYLSVVLQDRLEALPDRAYPLELLIEQVGTPQAEEEDGEPAEDPPAEPDDDSGPSTPVALGVGVGGALIGFALAAAALRRRR